MPRIVQIALVWASMLSQAVGQPTLAEAPEFSQLARRLAGDSPTPRWRMTLTYLPSFHPESQIILSELSGSEGTATVATFQQSARRLLHERHSIGGQLDIEGFKADTGYSVKRIAMPVPKLRKWLYEASRQIPGSLEAIQRKTEALPRGEVLVQLDGTLYCLDVEVGSDRLTSAISGSEVDTGNGTDDPQLVRFMRSLRDELVKMAAAAR